MLECLLYLGGTPLKDQILGPWAVLPVLGFPAYGSLTPLSFSRLARSSTERRLEGHLEQWSCLAMKTNDHSNWTHTLSNIVGVPNFDVTPPFSINKQMFFLVEHISHGGVPPWRFSSERMCTSAMGSSWGSVSPAKAWVMTLPWRMVPMLGSDGWKRFLKWSKFDASTALKTTRNQQIKSEIWQNHRNLLFVLHSGPRIQHSTNIFDTHGFICNLGKTTLQ